MELLALITLRVTEPELHRPFRIPLRTPALALLCAPALAFCLGVVVLSLYNGRATRIFWAFAIVAGAAGSWRKEVCLAPGSTDWLGFVRGKREGEESPHSPLK